MLLHYVLSQLRSHCFSFFPHLRFISLVALTIIFLLGSANKLWSCPFGNSTNEELFHINIFSTHNFIEPKDMNVTRHLPDMRIQNANYIKPPKSSVLRQYTVYREDQLLSNPGGDNFFVNKSSDVIDNNYDHSRFSKRIGKDLKDTGSNLLNVVQDIGMGAKIKYVDNHGKIKEGRKVGLVKTFSSFFKNVASGLTFGVYTREGEAKPNGGIGRVKHLFKKILKDAVVEDIVKGVPKSIIHVGEDVMFAGLNSIEIIPDATIGNFKAGRKATTKIFDNVQVALDFATDVMPGGEASGRTRSFKLAKGLKGLPIINNITMPEKEIKEPDWKYVRNTNFRKVIETISSLVPVRM
ncbi:MAG: hypothetical protein ACE5KZ_07795 [Candidatus Scalinduaceae bacterium]